jgi:hypothetical protein
VYHVVTWCLRSRGWRGWHIVGAEAGRPDEVRHAVRRQRLHRLRRRVGRRRRVEGVVQQGGRALGGLLQVLLQDLQGDQMFSVKKSPQM